MTDPGLTDPGSNERGSVPPPPQGRFEVLIWDLDGTLVDTKADLTLGINGLLQEYGLEPLTEETVARHVGNGARILVARCLEERGRSLPDSAAVEAALRVFERHYEAHLLDSTDFYPGLRDVVVALHRRGQKMAIATNKPERLSLRILEGLSALSYFDAVVGSDASIPQRKPDPAPVTAALRLASSRAAPADSLMIGDSSVDVEAGHRAGMPVCGVAWGLGPAGEVFAADPEFGVRCVAELARALGVEQKMEMP